MNSPITYVFLCRIIGTPLDSIYIVRRVNRTEYSFYSLSQAIPQEHYFSTR